MAFFSLTLPTHLVPGPDQTKAQRIEQRICIKVRISNAVLLKVNAFECWNAMEFNKES